MAIFVDNVQSQGRPAAFKQLRLILLMDIMPEKSVQESLSAVWLTQCSLSGQEGHFRSQTSVTLRGEEYTQRHRSYG